MIREYECVKCKKIIERIERYEDTPLEKCEVCGGNLKPVLFSLSTFQLKGNGWYKTDYSK